MTDRQDQELACSIHKALTACRIIKNVSLVCLVCFLILWALFFVLQLIGFLNDGFDLIAFVHSILFGSAVAVILISVIRIFSDAKKQVTPFTSKQSKRIVVIAIMVLILAINDVLFPMSELIYTSSFSQYIGFEIDTGDTYSPPTLNLGMLLFSLLLMCLSVIFKYGYLLQQLSDETV